MPPRTAYSSPLRRRIAALCVNTFSCHSVGRCSALTTGRKLRPSCVASPPMLARTPTTLNVMQSLDEGRLASPHSKIE
eukprot:3010232-Prymnesium_polylepis.2